MLEMLLHLKIIDLAIINLSLQRSRIGLLRRGLPSLPSLGSFCDQIDPDKAAAIIQTVVTVMVKVLSV